MTMAGFGSSAMGNRESTQTVNFPVKLFESRRMHFYAFKLILGNSFIPNIGRALKKEVTRTRHSLLVSFYGDEAVWSIIRYLTNGRGITSKELNHFGPQ
jgi:hypothetical protein